MQKQIQAAGVDSTCFFLKNPLTGKNKNRLNKSMFNRISIAAGTLLFIGNKLLLQKNKRYNRYNLISGHFEREVDEYSIKNTSIREIQEELPGLRYLIDFKIQPIHKNRILWQAETLRDGKVFQTLYIFKFYRAILLFRNREFSERLFSSEQEAEEYFSRTGENILIPVEKLHELTESTDEPELSLSGFQLGLPVKKAYQVDHKKKTESYGIEKEQIHPFIQDNLGFPLQFSSVLAISEIDCNIKDWIENIHQKNGLVCIDWKPQHLYWQTEQLQKLVELKEMGVDVILYNQQETTESELFLFEHLDLIYWKAP